MTYKTLAEVNATTDVSNLLIYVNEITNGYAMPSVLLAFFLIAMISGYVSQLRFRGIARFDFAFMTAGFVTFGLAVLMSMKNGLLAPTYLATSLAVAILGVVWVALSSDN